MPTIEEEDVFNSESKMTIFYKIVHALKGNRSLYYKGTYTPTTQTVIQTDSTMGCMPFQYGVGEEDYFVQSANSTTLSLPTTTEQGSSIINAITFHANQDVLQHFKYVLQNCPHLTSLDIICFNQDQKLTPAGPEGDRYYSYKINNNRVIKLKGISLNDELLDLLSTYLPNIESLKCKSCRSRYNHHINNNNDSKDLVLDLTGLKSLYYFNFNIKNLLRRAKYVVVQFKYPDSELADWFVIKKLEQTTNEYSNDRYTFTPATTIEFIKESQGKDNIRVVKFRCNRISQVVICTKKENIIAELNFGVLKASSTASDIK